MNQAEFEARYGKVTKSTPSDKASNSTLHQWFRKAFHNSHPAAPHIAFTTRLVGLMPILQWLPHYSLRENLHSDVITGLTVGIMVVPQGMAYATLAGLDPIYGLYSCFFPALTYMFFGTSRHVSIGTFAVASMMVGAVKNELLPSEEPSPWNVGEEGSNVTNRGFDCSALELTSALTFCVAICQLAMAVCRLSFLTSYISDPLVSGFTTGAAIHVLTSQLDKAIGVRVSRRSGAGMILSMWRDLALSIQEANPYTVGITAFGLVFLTIGRDWVNPWFKRRHNIPLPLELFLVVIAIAVSMLTGLKANYGVKIVQHVPEGMPVPAWPRLDLVVKLMPHAVSISIICYIFVFSMGKIFAKKHKYRLDANQELFALSCSQLVASFFPVYPSGASLSRSSLCEMTNAKTLLHALFSSALLFAVIMWMGSWLEPLPMAILACIVIVSLKNLFMQVKEVPRLWRVSKVDCAVWLIAFLSTVCLDVTTGLLLGLASVLLSVVVREQWPKFHELGVTSKSSGLIDAGAVHFRPMGVYTRLHSSAAIGQQSGGGCPKVRIYRFESPLHFANATRFIEQCAEINAELANGALAERRPSIGNQLVSVTRTETAAGMPVEKPSTLELNGGEFDEVEHLRTPPKKSSVRVNSSKDSSFSSSSPTTEPLLTRKHSYQMANTTTDSNTPSPPSLPLPSNNVFHIPIT